MWLAKTKPEGAVGKEDLVVGKTYYQVVPSADVTVREFVLVWISSDRRSFRRGWLDMTESTAYAVDYNMEPQEYNDNWIFATEEAAMEFSVKMAHDFPDVKKLYRRAVAAIEAGVSPE